MPTTFSWSFTDIDAFTYTAQADGTKLVTNVKGALIATDGNNTIRTYFSMPIEAPPAGVPATAITPFEKITQEKVEGWMTKVMTTDGLKNAKADMASRLAAMALAPQVTTAPWVPAVTTAPAAPTTSSETKSSASTTTTAETSSSSSDTAKATS